MLRNSSANETPIRSLEEMFSVLKRIEGALLELQQRFECQRVKDYYSVEETALRLKRAPWTVRNWCRLGVIEAIRPRNGYGVGGRWRIPHAELERLEREGVPSGDAPSPKHA